VTEFGVVYFREGEIPEEDSCFGLSDILRYFSLCKNNDLHRCLCSREVYDLRTDSLLFRLERYVYDNLLFNTTLETLISHHSALTSRAFVLRQKLQESHLFSEETINRFVRETSINDLLASKKSLQKLKKG
jgi:hypothetical protein